MDQVYNLHSYACSHAPKEANELCEEADVIIVKAAPYFSMDTLVHRYKHAHFVQSSCYIKLFLQAKVVCQVRVKVCQIGLPCTRVARR